MRRTPAATTLIFRFPTLPPPPPVVSWHALFFPSHPPEVPYGKHASVPFSSAASQLSHYSSWRSHQDEDCRSVKVSVWWDFENCSVPAGVNVFLVAQRITSALRANGIKGPVTINAFGDVSQLARAKQEALTSTGICLTHVPNSGKNSADRSLLVDLISWASQNPPPAHLFLISGDSDFAKILHRLRMGNYNVLLASSDSALGVLCSAASIMWHWNGLVTGENLAGRHFNHPPDGSFASWYGHYKGSLEDPFAETASKEPEESSEQPRPIPKTLVKRIRQILMSYPDGIGLSDLRLELARNNVPIDKDFFGHKKFSKFLLALPNVVKIERNPSGEGNSFLFGIHVKAPEAQSVPKPSAGDPCNGPKHCHPSNGRLSSIPAEKPRATQPVELQSKPPKTVIDDVNEGAGALGSRGSTSMPKASHLKVEVQACVSHEETKSQDPVGEEGTFQKFWRTWFGTRVADEDKIQQSSEMSDTKRTAEKLRNSLADAQATSSSSVPEVSDSRKETIVSSDDKASSNWQNFKWIINWCKFWKPNDNIDTYSKKKDTHNSISQCSTNEVRRASAGEEVKGQGGANKLSPEVGNHELFAKEYFWNDIESFLKTTNGFAVVSRSRNREQLAQELQKEGPLILKSLSPQHLSCLIRILIFEREWVEEFSYLFFPFKLVLPYKRMSSSPNVSHGFSSGISTKSSEFSVGNVTGTHPPSLIELKSWSNTYKNSATVVTAEDFKRDFEREFNTRLDCGFYGFDTVENLLEGCLPRDLGVQRNRKQTSNSREEILSDCRKLLEGIFAIHPAPLGFHLGLFKPLFHEKYGYLLDNQGLGYPKLASLLQTLPGVKVENNVILPDVRGTETNQSGKMRSVLESISGEGCISINETVESCTGNDIDSSVVDEDAVWEELGPVSSSVSPENGADSEGSDLSNPEVEDQNSVDEESLLSEEDFSDSESEKLGVNRIERERMCSSEDSSLLQILDSWYSSKEDKGSKSLEKLD